MAASAATRRAVAKSARGGGSLLGDIARKAANSRKSKPTRSGPKASETDHLSDQQFTGKHHAPSSSSSVEKNVSTSMNSPAKGRHARRSETGPKHKAKSSPRAEESNYMHDLKGAVKDRQGTGYVGKHRKTGA
jgi:hypothetical protein